MSQKIRMRQLTIEEAREAIAAYDMWSSIHANMENIAPEDIGYAAQTIRRLDLNLRAPDAIHIGITRRLSLTLATFDERMAFCSRSLGVALAQA